VKFLLTRSAWDQSCIEENEPFKENPPVDPNPVSWVVCTHSVEYTLTPPTRPTSVGPTSHSSHHSPFPPHPSHLGLPTPVTWAPRPPKPRDNDPGPRRSKPREYYPTPRCEDWNPISAAGFMSLGYLGIITPCDIPSSADRRYLVEHDLTKVAIPVASRL